MRKKLDNRIRVLIENGVAQRHRSMFVIVGDKGREQVPILHHILSKAPDKVKARPSTLWCYKKDLEYSSNRRKRMRQMQKKIRSGQLIANEDDPFELFMSTTDIKFCYYADTHKILGNTYGMLVLADFEALTPNIIARTVETIEGGGLVILLLKSMTSLKQLYTMTMDVHARYRTESHQDVVGRFNERFLLSLASCNVCMAVDDRLQPLPLTSSMLSITPVPSKTLEDSLSPNDQQLIDLKESLQDTQPVGAIINCCKTLDQAKALLKFVDAISEETLSSTVALTAARGRGKSAALGLAMALAIAHGYSNIFVTSPTPENLKTLFEFIFKGFDALDFQEHSDYQLVESTNPDFNKAIVRVNVFREHRQTIQYIHPTDSAQLTQAELVVIDEAAAIPLPLVKNLLGPYLVFISSTVNGYEGTGRSLSLKLFKQLREQSLSTTTSNPPASSRSGRPSTVSAAPAKRSLVEVTLDESIRYGAGDPVERWLYDLLCLDCTAAASLGSSVIKGRPAVELCELYYVSRDTLFSYHAASEQFLQRVMTLFVSSHYKNTPNDLQLLSDAPAHHIFVLLPPIPAGSSSLPEVICVIQVCLEGDISKGSVLSNLARGKSSSGDLIPWTISQQFQDNNFPSLSGARIIRIATHPDYQKMGYGSQAITLLRKYYDGLTPDISEDQSHEASQNGGEESSKLENLAGQDVSLLEERVAPRKNLPPLLVKLSERKAEKLDYLGVSYGATSQLFSFWKKCGFRPVYVGQNANDLTGEHTCVMLSTLGDDSKDTEWLQAYWQDFRRRYISLLSYDLRAFKAPFALNTIHRKADASESISELTLAELGTAFGQYDLKRLDLYARTSSDRLLITDLLPCLAQLFFLNRLPIHLSVTQQTILLGMGLQRKSPETIESELNMPVKQILALFQKAISKMSSCLHKILERDVEEEMVAVKDVSMLPTQQTLSSDLKEGADAETARLRKEKLALALEQSSSKYAIRGNDEEWAKAAKKTDGLVSIKSGVLKRKLDSETASNSHPAKEVITGYVKKSANFKKSLKSKHKKK